MRQYSKDKTALTAFRLPQAELDQLKALAQARGRPLSELLRDLAGEYLAENKEADMVQKPIIPDVMGLVRGDSTKGKSTNFIQSMLDQVDAKPIRVNGVFYPGGLAEYNKAMKAKEQGMHTKDIDEFIPGNVKSFADLDAWRSTQLELKRVMDDASAMQQMIGNITMDPEGDHVAELEALGREFSARQAKGGDKAKERSGDASKALTALWTSLIREVNR